MTPEEMLDNMAYMGQWDCSGADILAGIREAGFDVVPLGQSQAMTIESNSLFGSSSITIPQPQPWVTTVHKTRLKKK